MLAISAMLAKTRENPAVTMMNPHINPAVPPSVSTLLSKLLKGQLHHLPHGL